MFTAIHTPFIRKAQPFLLVLSILTFATMTMAQGVLTEDAHTKSDFGTRNYGGVPNLSVSPSENSYIKFRVGATLPSNTPGSDVARATLKLYVGSVNSPGKLDVYMVTSAWTESSITFNTAPSIGNLIATTAQIQTDSKGKYIVIDLTTAVAQWLGDDGRGTNGTPNNGVAIMVHPIDADTPSLANVVLDSKENSQTSHEPELSIALKSNGLVTIAHDSTLRGDGKTTDPLGVANQAIGTAQLANDAVTGQKIATGQVVKSLNGLSDGVTLQAGSNITITPSGNTIRIDSTSSGLSSVARNSTLSGDGTSANPLAVAAPLTLSGSDSNAILSVANAGPGPAINATGDINTSARYSISGTPILSAAGTQNIFVGNGAGAANTGNNNAFAGYFAGNSNSQGSSNSFFGSFAGRNNTTGTQNSFFGAAAGPANTTGLGNAFFGVAAGQSNTEGSFNHFFGVATGQQNTTGRENAFFGANAGIRNTTGNRNAFFGSIAGGSNSTGSNNAMFGDRAGSSNTTEDNNTFLGGLSNGSPGITNATAVGPFARVTQSYSVVLGNNANVGVGVSAPSFKMHVVDPANTGLRVQTNTAGGTVASFGGNGDFQVDAPGVPSGRFLVKEDGKVGIGTATPSEKLSVAGTIESTSGGIKFPDGTVQTSAATLTSAIGETRSVFIPGLGNAVQVNPLGSPANSVYQMTLPAGNYLLLATINFVNEANFLLQDNRRLIVCNFPNSFYRFWIEGVGNENEKTVTFHSTVSLSQPGTVDLVCVAGSGGTDRSWVRAGERNITAIRVGEFK